MGRSRGEASPDRGNVGSAGRARHAVLIGLGVSHLMEDGVFISYRRGDSQVVVEHLMPRLVEQFGSGQIYRDLDSNRPGFDSTKEMEAALDASAVVLVMIGPGWVNATDEATRRRLDDPGDSPRNPSRNPRCPSPCVNG